jgi:glycosyltransferase involved in cell wall biosynthesis
MSSLKPVIPDGLSIVIPLYNEEDSVSETVSRLLGLLPHLPNQHEIILVNDGSQDGTLAALQSATPTEKGFKVISHTQNRGYGASLKTGIRKAQYEWVAIADADGTYPLDQIPVLLKHAVDNQLAMVVGSRTGSNVKQPLIRRPPKWILRMLASSLSGTHIPDMNSGLRVFSKAPLLKYLSILPDGFSFTTTITLALLSKGYPIDYIPINLYMRKGRSKIRPVYDTLNFLQLICRTVLWLNPLRVFLPLSALFVALGVMVFIYSWKFMERTMDVTSGLLIQTGIIILAVGMLADLIDKRSD